MNTNPTPSTRPDRLIVVADHTPGVHRTDTDDVGWWLPVLGPTATVLAGLLARDARRGDTHWDTTALARTVGLAGNRNKLWASLERLVMFRCASFPATDVIVVRLELPALTDRQLERLPEQMAAAYPHRCRA